MKLCMFRPKGLGMDRGWPGRVEGDHVVQLAAQTLQAYFTGGGAAREHAVYPLADVELLAPVHRPPNVRIFGKGLDFAFGNAAAIAGPGADVRYPHGASKLVADVASVAIVGAESTIAGTTGGILWRAPELPGMKSYDFALTIGPMVITPDELDASGWDERRAHAAHNTRLISGDLLVDPTGPSAVVERGPYAVAIDGIGTLTSNVI